MDEDPTVRLERNGRAAADRRRGVLSRWVAGLALGAVVAAVAAGTVWYLRRPPAPPPLPVGSEAQIRDETPTRLMAYRFAADPKVIVLDFPTLLEQGLMLDRVAAFAEKHGEPHDRVLTDAELTREIAKGGDTVATYYYGHDYSSAELRRFFEVADRDHVRLNAQEEWFRRFATEQGVLAPDANQAVITVPRQGADPLVDASFRRTILHHELSHGEYFTDPAYVAYVYHFWNDVMSAHDRALFTRFLVAQDYDPALHDLIVNETQAYLMHTADPRAFSAAALGMAPDRLAWLRAQFLLGMPPGWLRDCTTLPPPPETPAAPAPLAQAPAAPAAPASPRRQRSTVSTGTAATATRSPRRTAASSAARRAAT